MTTIRTKESGAIKNITKTLVKVNGKWLAVTSVKTKANGKWS